MNRLKVKIRTLSPVVLTTESNTTVMTETHDVIGGSILRGVMAERYIKTQKLGGEAHRDETFRRLFLGELRFVDANPVCRDNGLRSFAIPFSMQKEKTREDDEPEKLEDLTRLEAATPGLKSFRGYAVMTPDRRIQTVSVQKDILMHMSRMSENERKLGHSKDGGIYNYESMDAGQDFEGAVLGEEADLSLLRDSLGQSFECRIGRSKFTQYGRCRIEFEEGEAPAPLSVKNLEPDGSVILFLDSPFLYDDFGGEVMMTANRALSVVADKMNEQQEGKPFKVEKVFSAWTEIENYVAVWGMKRPRQQALAAGTVFALARDGEWTQEDFAALEKLMYRGIGLRTQEGFGQLRYWPEPAGIAPKRTDGANPVKTSFGQEKASSFVADIAKRVLERKLVGQLRVYAAKDAGTAGHDDKLGVLSGMQHFFSRLDHLLSVAKSESEAGKKTLKEAYQAVLAEQVRPGSPMEKNLRHTRIQINERTLYDILISGQDLPYLQRSWIKDLGAEEEKTSAYLNRIGFQEKNIELGSDNFFYEYWHWFFRFARKRAATNTKGVENDG